MRFKKFTAVILIIMLLMIPIKQAEAIAPAIGPAIYYGVASLLVASGVYAATDDDLQYLVNDYWNRTSDNIKYRWQQAKLYAGVAGYLLIDKGIIGDMNRYLIYEKGITVGSNTIDESNVIDNPGIVGVQYDSINGYHNDYYYSDTYKRWFIICRYPDGGYSGNIAAFNTLEECLYSLSKSYITVEEGWPPGTLYIAYYVFKGADYTSGKITPYIIGDSIIYGEGYNYTVDAAGIGHELQPEQELKVPVPPVLEKDFPDLWTDLNLARNPHLSAENQKRVLDELLGGDWYYDAENDRWYQVKKDDPPLKPGDEKKVGPLMPLPMPSTDLNTPTADAPDITTTTGPETTVTTQNQDGTTTETTTQDITETKTWYDTETGWNTETSTRTKTTTTVRDQDGTELSRDVVMGPPTGTTTTQETPKRDDDRINWDPLKLPILGLTMKFPFSLPWDLMRGLESLQSDSEWDRKFIIAVGDDLWPEMEIDLSMFDNIAQIVKVILLILFDFGLIFSTRRLMGGDV